MRSKGISLLIVVMLLLACKKDKPSPPGVAVLVFPLPNSECTTGIDLTETTSQVEFRWQPSQNTETYVLRARNQADNSMQSITTTATLANLPLKKGAAYSWFVISQNSQTPETKTSETRQFYNAGSQTSYAPFPAQIIAPKSGQSVPRDINQEVTLQWSGADADNDLERYEVYLSTTNPPETLIASPSLSVTSIKFGVAANTAYYWKVVSFDREGNSSDSGVYSFRAL